MTATSTVTTRRMERYMGKGGHTGCLQNNRFRCMKDARSLARKDDFGRRKEPLADFETRTRPAPVDGEAQSLHLVRTWTRGRQAGQSPDWRHCHWEAVTWVPRYPSRWVHRRMRSPEGESSAKARYCQECHLIGLTMMLSLPSCVVERVEAQAHLDLC